MGANRGKSATVGTGMIFSVSIDISVKFEFLNFCVCVCGGVGGGGGGGIEKRLSSASLLPPGGLTVQFNVLELKHVLLCEV